MKNPYRLGMLIVVGLSLIQAGCKSFTLSNDDIKVIKTSNQLLLNEKQRVDQNTYRRLYNMHTNVVEGGYRSKDIEVIHEALKLWQEYHQLSNSISNFSEKLPKDSTEIISFYHERMDVSGEEFRHKARFPFREVSFYNNDHLNLELAYYGEYVIDKLSTRVGGHHPAFHTIKLAVVHSEDEVNLFVPLNERGDFIHQISIPSALQDALTISNLQPWTTLEYAIDSELIKLGILNEIGDTIAINLGHPTKVEVWN